MIAGVWKGVGFTYLKKFRTRIWIQTFWNRSGVEFWKCDPTTSAVLVIWASTYMYIPGHSRASLLIGSSAGLSTTAQTSPYRFCSPCSCILSNHIIRLKLFCLHYAFSQFVCISECFVLATCVCAIPAAHLRQRWALDWMWIGLNRDYDEFG